MLFNCILLFLVCQISRFHVISGLAVANCELLLRSDLPLGPLSFTVQALEKGDYSVLTPETHDIFVRTRHSSDTVLWNDYQLGPIMVRLVCMFLFLGL